MDFNNCDKNGFGAHFSLFIPSEPTRALDRQDRYERSPALSIHTGTGCFRTPCRETPWEFLRATSLWQHPRARRHLSLWLHCSPISLSHFRPCSQYTVMYWCKRSLSDTNSSTLPRCLPPHYFTYPVINIAPSATEAAKTPLLISLATLWRHSFFCNVYQKNWSA